MQIVLDDFLLEIGDTCLVGFLGEFFVELQDDVVELFYSIGTVYDFLLEFGQLRYALTVQLLEVIVLGKALKVAPNTLSISDSQFGILLLFQVFEILNQVIKFFLDAVVRSRQYFKFGTAFNMQLHKLFIEIFQSIFDEFVSGPLRKLVLHICLKHIDPLNEVLILNELLLPSFKVRYSLHFGLKLIFIHIELKFIL